MYIKKYFSRNSCSFITVWLRSDQMGSKSFAKC